MMELKPEGNKPEDVVPSDTSQYSLTDSEQLLEESIEERRRRREKFRVCCCDRCYRDDCVIMWYVTLVICFVAAFGMVIAFGTQIVKPYVHTLGFTQTICQVVAANTTGRAECSFRKGRYSSGISWFRCLRIYMNYTDSQGLSHITMLHNTEYNLDDQSQCSKVPACSKYEILNDSEVNAFEDHYGIPGQTYTCFYNPQQPGTELIRVRKGAGGNMVLHTILWSSCAMIGCLVSLLIVYWQCGCGPWKRTCMERFGVNFDLDGEPAPRSTATIYRL